MLACKHDTAQSSSYGCGVLFLSVPGLTGASIQIKQGSTLFLFINCSSGAEECINHCVMEKYVIEHGDSLTRIEKKLAELETKIDQILALLNANKEN